MLKRRIFGFEHEVSQQAFEPEGHLGSWIARLKLALPAFLTPVAQLLILAKLNVVELQQDDKEDGIINPASSSHAGDRTRF